MKPGYGFLILTLGAALACGGGVDVQPVPPPSPEWVGTWTGQSPDGSMIVDIHADGMVHYETSGAMSATLDVPAQAWREDGFDIGVSIMSKTLVVTSKPHDDAGTWKMTVDGMELTRELVAPVPEPGPEIEEPAVTAPEPNPG